LFIATANPATAAQIKILAGSAIATAMAVLIPQFEKSSGHKVAFDFDGAIGAMTDRIQKGEAADVVIVSGLQIEMLEKQGKVVSGSRTDIARVGVGLFDLLERVACEAGDASLVVSATPSLNTVGFYERRGFRPMAAPLPSVSHHTPKPALSCT
jgi:hypothetical protein